MSPAIYCACSGLAAFRAGSVVELSHAQAPQVHWFRPSLSLTTLAEEQCSLKLAPMHFARDVSKLGLRRCCGNAPRVS